MIVTNAELFTTAVNKAGFPADGLPEVAFAGRSNVGKSSLINSMIYRKALARTSKQPGKTRTLNFYTVGYKADAGSEENAVLFVDLPGYGYAKVSKSEKEKWGGMIEGYLKSRDELMAVVLLIDLRHPPTENDVTMYEWLKYYDKEIIIAATKSDKLKRSQIGKHVAEIKKALGFEGVVIPFSSETKDGRDSLWEKITGAV